MNETYLIGFALEDVAFAGHFQQGRHGKGPILAFKDVKGTIDFLVDNDIGNFIAVNACRLNKEARDYFGSMKIPVDVNSDGWRVIEYAMHKGLHVCSIYSMFTDQAAKRLQSPDRRNLFYPNLGERAHDARSMERWYQSQTSLPTRKEAIQEWIRIFRDQHDEFGRPGISLYAQQGFQRIGNVVTGILDSRYCFEAGITVPMAETMVSHVDCLLSNLRGAAKAKGLSAPLGVWIANGWYGPSYYKNNKDKVFELALYHALIYGCKQFVLESPSTGPYEYGEYCRNPDYPAAKAHLDILSQFYHFVRGLPKLKKFPIVRIGILRGQDDNFIGVKTLHGSNVILDNPKWTFGSAEANWEHIKLFFPQLTLDEESEHFWFSGTPYGPVDQVPIEASIAHLLQYDFLALLGHNTMDAAVYQHLKTYVVSGGTLLLAGAHMKSENEDLYQNGDWRDFVGVKCVPAARRSVWFERAYYTNSATIVDDGGIGLEPGLNFPCPRQWVTGCHVQTVGDTKVLARSERGTPLMTLRKLGKGKVFFYPMPDFPCERHAMNLYAYVLKQLARQTLCDCYLDGSQTTTYACGKTGNGDVVMLLNTSLSKPDEFALHLETSWIHRMRLEPGRFRLCFKSGPFLLYSDNTSLHIVDLNFNGKECNATLQGDGYGRLWVIVNPEYMLKSVSPNNGKVCVQYTAWNTAIAGLRLKGGVSLKMRVERKPFSWSPGIGELTPEIKSNR